MGITSPPGRRGQPRHRRAQPGYGLGVAVLVAVVQVGGTLVLGRPADVLDPLAYALLLAGPLALVLRRQAPVLVLTVTLAASVSYALLDYPSGPTFIAVVVAFFGAVHAGHRLASWLLAGAACLAYGGAGRLVDEYGTGRLAEVTLRVPTPGELAAVAAWLLVVLALAEALRVQAAHVVHLERLRMAGDLHDLLGRQLSVIDAQAGVGLRLVGTQPDQARAALTAIRAASNEARRQVWTVLGALRPDQEWPGRVAVSRPERVADLDRPPGQEHRSSAGAGRDVDGHADLDRAAN